MEGKYCTSPTNRLQLSFEELSCWVMLSTPWSTSGIYVTLFLHKREHTCIPSKNKTWILSRKPHSIRSVCIETRMSSTFINQLCFQKKLAISSLPFYQKKNQTKTCWLFICRASNHPFWSPITYDPIVLWSCCDCDQRYFGDTSYVQTLLLSRPVCFSLSVATLPEDCCSFGGYSIHLSFFRPVIPFILTCCTWHLCTAFSFCRKYPVLGCCPLGNLEESY